MGEQGLIGVQPVVQLHPTRLCNLACAHCYSSSGPQARGELDLELLASCLHDAAALGYRQLAVSGGEPLLYGALAELLACARRLGMLTTITTNGLLVTARRWAAVAPLVDVVAISIDGTPGEHDAIRGRAGAFARTVANLEVIRRSGTPFGFIFTLTQYNADSLEFVVRLAAERGARSVQVHPLTLDGRAATALPAARPDGLELLAALLEAARLGRQLGVIVHVDAVTFQQLARYRDRLVPKRPAAALVDVAPTLIVEASGAVVPLTHDVDDALRLGALTDARLASLADQWLRSGRADALAAACQRTWTQLVDRGAPTPVYWYDEVAARTHADAGVFATSRHAA